MVAKDDKNDKIYPLAPYGILHCIKVARGLVTRNFMCDMDKKPVLRKRDYEELLIVMSRRDRRVIESCITDLRLKVKGLDRSGALELLSEIGQLANGKNVTNSNGDQS
jgi:hypothetical protein